MGSTPMPLSERARELIADPALLVGGQWQPGAATSIDAIDPYTERPLARIGSADRAQIDTAIGAARLAHDEGGWSRLSGAERSRLLQRALEAMDRDRDALIEIVTAETGSPISLSRALQIDPMLEHLEWFVNAAARGPRCGREYTLPPRSVGETVSTSVIVRESIGVVAALTPYNAPLVTAVWKVAGALAAGCTAVLVPSPRAALTTLAWVRLFEQADLPAGALSFLVGEEEVGRALTESADVDMVTFTGSNLVGRHVMRQAAGSFKRLVLELGGKSANVVLPGTDIEAAAGPSALRFLRNAGQTCGATTRTFVPRDRYDEFVAATRAFLPTVAVGDPWDEKTVVGPLISAEHRDRVEGYVQRAITAGGVLEAGGDRPDVACGHFLNPTVVGRVGNDSEIAREELFGPVGVVIAYDDVDEAVRMANASRYGLNANVWGPTPQALEVARRIRSGTVSVNGGGGGLRADAPFGGYRQSGIGREAGEDGFLEFFEMKQIQIPIR